MRERVAWLPVPSHVIAVTAQCMPLAWDDEQGALSMDNTVADSFHRSCCNISIQSFLLETLHARKLSSICTYPRQKPHTENTYLLFTCNKIFWAQRSTLLAFRPFNQISWSSFSAWSWLRCHRLTYGSNTHVKISGDIQYILCSRMDLVLDVNGLCDLSLKALKASECTFELS